MCQMGSMMAGMILWMLLGGLGLLAVIVAAVVLGLSVHRRRVAPPPAPAAVGGRDLAREELRRSYARGEIEREDFLVRDADLRDS